MKRAATLFGIFIALCIAKLCGASTLQLADSECYTIQHDGVTAFQATGIAPQTPPYTSVNYTGSCGIVPPPIDPNAMLSGLATFNLHAPPCQQTISPLTAMGSLFISAPNVAPVGWPFKPTAVNVTIPLGKVLDLGFTLPVNPGTLPHRLKGDLYAGSGACYKTSPTGIVASYQVLAATSASRAPVGACAGNVAFGSPWVTLNPLPDTATPTNMSYCNVFYPAGAGTLGQYHVPIKALANVSLSADLNWN